MRRWAVGWMTFFDNVLKIEIVEAEDWHSALLKHSKVGEDPWEFPPDLEEAKQEAFNGDCTFDVIEVQS